MEKAEYLKLYRFEESNWYFVSRRNFFFALLKKYMPKKKLNILDIGSGTGAILKRLKSYGKVTGIDNSKEAVTFCKKRGLNCLYAGGEKLPFNKEKFDLVTLFGVIEHAKNDESVLREVYRVCKKNAVIMIECPAYKFLWSEHDIALHHFRRYTAKELKIKLEKANFRVEKISYIYSFIFPVVAILRLLRKMLGQRTKKPHSDPVEKMPKFIDCSLLKLAKIEALLIKKINLPFGVSLVCVAKKIPNAGLNRK